MTTADDGETVVGRSAYRWNYYCVQSALAQQVGALSYRMLKQYHCVESSVAYVITPSIAETVRVRFKED
jgi:hypothetical protein